MFSLSTTGSYICKLAQTGNDLRDPCVSNAGARIRPMVQTQSCLAKLR